MTALMMVASGMVDAIPNASNAIANAMPSAILSPIPNSIPTSASVASFEDAMKTGVVGGPRDATMVSASSAPVGIAVDPTTGTPLTQQALADVNATNAVHTDGSVSADGDRILASLRQVSTDAAHLWDSLTYMANGHTVMDLPQLLRLQTGALQASVQFDYLGKIITKAGQDIDSLVKTQ